jgi:citrate lyase beta subunit
MRPIPRSMLFTPATKTDHFDAAANVGADAVILDLEDSVAPEAKDGARLAALNYLAAKRSSRTSAALRSIPCDAGRMAGFGRTAAVCCGSGFYRDPES